jgi:[protein-PII] uridylyltransferase
MQPPSTTSAPHDVPHSFATLLDREYARADFLRQLKSLIATAQERLRHEHQVGTRGRNVVRHLTALVDDVVRTVFQYAIAHHDAAHDTPYALLALGGYGRGELNPYSDIDLMFLCERTPPDNVVRETLYLLWDVGYTLGHSVRTRHDVVHMAGTDLTAQTAMLEARFVDGEGWLFDWFQEEIGRRRFGPRRRRAFVRQKSEEYHKRHAAFANTVNLMEPNIKESPGGLRDYHTALWLGMACYEAHSLAALVEQGVLTPTDQEAVDTALDFLFRVRNALHYHSGRKNDLLSVDVQEGLAAALGFTPGEHKQAVEHFLKQYYVHANVVFELGQTVLEAVNHTYQPRLWRFFRRPKDVNHGFTIVDGYLTHSAPALDEQVTARPLLLMQAFAKTQEYRVPLAPALSRMIKAQAPLLATEAFRRSPEAKALFFQMLSQPHAAPVLRAMHRHGLLGAYIPEFAPLTCLVQYDLYHRYTVDEHSLRSIEALERLSDTQEPTLRSLALLYHQTPDKALLKFALLLHDLGKDIGPRQASHVHRSGDLATSVYERLQLTAEQRHLSHILVVNHLLMNHLAQRRDLTDPKVIADFAAVVEAVPYLEQLYLLTFADTSAVGPGVWTVWKGALLAELYRRTLDYLVHRTESSLSDEELRHRLRPAIVEALAPPCTIADVDRFLEVMPARYLVATPPEQIATHIRLTQPALSAPVVLYTTHDVSVGFTNVTFCVEGRRGVFAMIAGALSHNGLNILGAQIYTSRDGLAVDTLQVETTEQTPVTDPRVWEHVRADVLAALAGERSFDEVLTRRRYSAHERKFQTFAQPPQVVLDNTISDSHTVIEVQTQDRLGLLYKLTRLLYEQGLDVMLAKISTEANRAIDVFYVTDSAGAKVVEEPAMQRIQHNLVEALR